MLDSSSRCLLAACLLVGTISGCSGSSGDVKRFAVSGQVSFRDQPLERGRIRFVPSSGTGQSAGARIEGGGYSLPEAKGLPAGDYTVQVTSADESAPVDGPPGESNQVATERIPEQYNVQSKLSISVTRDGEREFDFDLE